EDGIRGRNVTGVQTCALPIFDWQIHVYGEMNSDVETLVKETGLQLFHLAWDKSLKDKGMKETAVYLIRPDGHISAAADIENLGSIRSMVDEYHIQSLSG